MAVFGWIGHSELQRKIPGGINFAFLFSGGLKNAFTNSEGHFSLLYFCQGGFFRSKMDLERSKKKSGGLA